MAQFADYTDIIFCLVLPFHTVWMERIQTVATSHYVSLHPDHLLVVIVNRHVADTDDLDVARCWLAVLSFPSDERKLNQVHRSHHGR